MIYKVRDGRFVRYEGIIPVKEIGRPKTAYISLRTAAGMTAFDVAGAARISYPAYIAWENEEAQITADQENKIILFYEKLAEKKGLIKKMDLRIKKCN